MDAVNEGAKNADTNALTIGILPGKDKKQLSDCVDVGIVTGMDNARNNINILSSDDVIACGYGGSGTASEIALALQSGQPVILLTERRECIDMLRPIGGKQAHESSTVQGQHTP